MGWQIKWLFFKGLKVKTTLTLLFSQYYVCVIKGAFLGDL